MESKNIVKELNEIFLYRTNIDFEKNYDMRDLLLFGEKINIPERELVLILYDIESKMNIGIPKQAVINGEFDTFNHILNILLSINNYSPA